MRATPSAFAARSPESGVGQMLKWELPLKESDSPRRGLLELSQPELLAWLEQRGHPRLRASQLRRWIVAGRAVSFDEMTDLPQALRMELSAQFTPLATKIVRHLRASDGTEKLLLRLAD